MPDLNQIEEALAARPLDPSLFERFAQDTLSEIYPTLVPIPGGTDWGRDADIAGTTDIAAPKLLVTSARDLPGIRQNMLTGIESMKTHGVQYGRILLANPGSLNLTQRQKLVEVAKEEGATLDASDIFDRHFFASKLRRDGYWRRELLGLPGEPISLSSSPPELAENPWAYLPLVGRDDEITELQALISDRNDVVLTGPPGVGKSRLAVELEGVAFVDKDTPLERVADDLRWLQPTIVVADDAGGSEALIRQLVHIRQREQDLHAYQIIAICWPDEIDLITAWLRGAAVLKVSLLERSDMDTVLVNMGISNELARAEVLNQAEGRVGWAVALGDLLIRAESATLLNGKALYGQVVKYLVRAQIPMDTIDLLAAVAALGGVTEAELGALAEELDMQRAQLISLLTSAARSGIIDVESQYSVEAGHNLRAYQVRPPMLADVLVAERVFSADVPGLNLDELLEHWPNRLRPIIESVIDAALLGAEGARAAANREFERTISSGALDPSGWESLATRFLRLDANAADRVLELIRDSYAELSASAADPYEYEPLTRLAAFIAGRHKNPDAVRLLLDAAIQDDRPTNPNWDHPLRKLTELVSEFHPNLPLPTQLRYLVANTTLAWLEKGNASERRWQIYSHVMEACLSPDIRSSRTSPGDPHTVHIIAAVLPPEEMTEIYGTLWPKILEKVDSSPAASVAAVVDTVAEWLRVGSGKDQPFGQSHPQAAIDRAREIGESMLAELAAVPNLSTGLRIRLRSVATRHNLAVTVDGLGRDEAFFTDMDLRANWQEAEQEVIRDLRAWTAEHSIEPPRDVVARLRRLKEEVSLAHITWPDRIWIATDALAELTEEPLLWLQEAIEADLMPEGTNFIRPLVQSDEFTLDLLDELMSQTSTRWRVIEEVLRRPGTPDWAAERVVELLEPSDYGQLELMFLRRQISNELTRELMGRTSGVTRGMVALAFFDRGRTAEDAWPPEDLLEPWLESLLDLRPAKIASRRSWQVTELFKFVAAHHPPTLTQIVQKCILEAEDDVYHALPHDSWQVLHMLPAEERTKLWNWSREQRPVARWLLSEHLISDDVGWLAAMLDSGSMTADDVLGAPRGFGGPEPTIEQLARLLVPRGVAPERVAGVALSGSWMGEESDHYASLVSYFERLQQDEDESAREVGTAGVQMFTEARDAAAAREKQQRIRGEL